MSPVPNVRFAGPLDTVISAELLEGIQLCCGNP